MSVSLKDQSKDICGEGTAPSLCAACGADFSCGANLGGADTQAGCWCFGVKLSEAARKELETRFQGCLCERCLRAFASEQPGES